MMASVSLWLDCDGNAQAPYAALCAVVAVAALGSLAPLGEGFDRAILGSVRAQPAPIALTSASQAASSDPAWLLARLQGSDTPSLLHLSERSLRSQASTKGSSSQGMASITDALLVQQAQRVDQTLAAFDLSVQERTGFSLEELVARGYLVDLADKVDAVRAAAAKSGSLSATDKALTSELNTLLTSKRALDELLAAFDADGSFTLDELEQVVHSTEKTIRRHRGLTRDGKTSYLAVLLKRRNHLRDAVLAFEKEGLEVPHALGLQMALLAQQFEVGAARATLAQRIEDLAESGASVEEYRALKKRLAELDTRFTHASGIELAAVGPAAGDASAVKDFLAQPQGVSASQLLAIMPNLGVTEAEQYAPLLNRAMEEASINTPARQAAFIAQLAHESIGLMYFEELASGSAYEGRRDLGNVYAGDGKRYKGRGPIQLTGRANYRAAGQALGVDLEGNPELAAHPEIGFRIAAWYWQTRGLNKLADVGDFDRITLLINGGYNGAQSRRTYWATAQNVLS